MARKPRLPVTRTRTIVRGCRRSGGEDFGFCFPHCMEERKMCSVATVFTNLATLTCEAVCKSDAAREAVNLKQKKWRQRRSNKSMTRNKCSKSTHRQKVGSAPTVKQCAVVKPTVKLSSTHLERRVCDSGPHLSCSGSVQRRSDESGSRVRDVDSQGSSSGVSTADSRLEQEMNTAAERQETTRRARDNAANREDLPIAPDAFYDSRHCSCSVLSLPIVSPLDGSAVRKYRKRNRPLKKFKRKGSEKPHAKDRKATICAIDNLVVNREDRKKIQAEEKKMTDEKLVDLSFSTCLSKENVDQCTCKISAAKLLKVSIVETQVRQEANYADASEVSA